MEKGWVEGLTTSKYHITIIICMATAEDFATFWRMGEKEIRTFFY